MREILLLMALAGLLVGCAEETETPPTFSEIQSEILVPSCGFSSCHGSGSGGLTLDDSIATYDNLVGAESEGSPGSVLVVPGDADGSYLIQKLEGAEGIAGDPMPVGSPLDMELIIQVRAWIDAGAAND